jgi:hypothetical protein
LAAFYLLAVIGGGRSAYYWQPSHLDVLLNVTLVVVLSTWAIHDSMVHGRPIPLLARAWFVIAIGIVVPGYILWSRGWRGLGWLLLHAVGWYAVATGSMLVTRGFLLGWE